MIRETVKNNRIRINRIRAEVQVVVSPLFFSFSILFLFYFPWSWKSFWIRKIHNFENKTYFRTHIDFLQFKHICLCFCLQDRTSHASWYRCLNFLLCTNEVPRVDWKLYFEKNPGFYWKQSYDLLFSIKLLQCLTWQTGNHS